jgi:probable F420-dependent oxidoreductase
MATTIAGGPIGIWSLSLRFGDPGPVKEAAAELEDLGYSALWMPDMGGDVFGAVTQLLDATETVTVATGILNIWMHEPAAIASGIADTIGRYPGRFLLGVGVGHAIVIDAVFPGRYRRPLQAMETFLDGLDQAQTPVPQPGRVLAALGPRMLALAKDRAGGAHPYLSTPDHTAVARAVLGPGKFLAPEQRVVLETDPERARAEGRSHLAIYLTLPNYRNNLLRSGFTEDDMAGGGSDRLVDALVAWGDEDTIRRRVYDHIDAGADHVCIQALSTDQTTPTIDAWRRLAPILI